MSSEARHSAEGVVDELLPGDFDWEHLVRSYPIPALVVAAVGGFLIGRAHGPTLVSALSSFAVGEVTRNAQAMLGVDPGAAGDDEP